MDAEQEEELLVLETKAAMVSLTGSRQPIQRLAHFLLPTADPEAPFPLLPCKPISRLEAPRIVFEGWRTPGHIWRQWVDKLSPIYSDLWRTSGIFDAIQASTFKVRKDPSSITGVLQFWSGETNTFHFQWGEATVTLEDVTILGGYPVLGEPVRGCEVAELEDVMVVELKRVTRGRCRKAQHSAWANHFIEGKGDQTEHIAFLTLWLCRFVFPEKVVRRSLFPIAIKLSRGARVALAPAVLASLYRDMRSMINHLAASWEGESSPLVVRAPFLILQLWLWERFMSLRPPLKQADASCVSSRKSDAKCDEPRVGRWHDMGKRTEPSFFSSVLESGSQFQWRAYTIGLDNWSKGFYKEDAGWFYNAASNEALESFLRCLRPCELVGLDCIEQYLPHRVAMQFGLDQDIPSSVARANSSWEVAWETYDMTNKKARFYVPSRLSKSDVSHRYSIWWKQHMEDVRRSRKAVSLPKLKTKMKKRKLEDVSFLPLKMKLEDDSVPPLRIKMSTFENVCEPTLNIEKKKLKNVCEPTLKKEKRKLKNVCETKMKIGKRKVRDACQPKMKMKKWSSEAVCARKLNIKKSNLKGVCEPTLKMSKRELEDDGQPILKIKKRNSKDACEPTLSNWLSLRHRNRNSKLKHHDSSKPSLRIKPSLRSGKTNKWDSDSSWQAFVEELDDILATEDQAIENEMQNMNFGDSSCDSTVARETEVTLQHHAQYMLETDGSTEPGGKESQREMEITKLKEEVAMIQAKLVYLQSLSEVHSKPKKLTCFLCSCVP